MMINLMLNKSFVINQLQVDGFESAHVGGRSHFMARAMRRCNLQISFIFNINGTKCHIDTQYNYRTL